MLIAGLVAFVVVTWLAELVIGVHRPLALGPLLAGAMAAIPAVLWLAFFYSLDQHDREPKQLIAGVAVLGMLIAGPSAEFVQRLAVPPVALAVHDLSAISLDRVVFAVFVVGLAQEVCKYAVVRYSIYLSNEFSQPMDGIVYMMACGTGVAIWVNYHRLSGEGHQVILSTGAAQAVVTTLAHASFAGVLGYVLGRAKFSRRTGIIRAALLLVGLLGAAAVNGQFTLVENWVLQTGMAQHPWRGIGYAALCAASVFVAIWVASRRLDRTRKESAVPTIADVAQAIHDLPSQRGAKFPPDPVAAPPAQADAADEFDPVATAAAALSRLHSRALSELEQLRRYYQRHDGVVLVIALGMMIAGGRVHARLVTPPTTEFSHHGLTFTHSTAWLAPEPIRHAPLRLVVDSVAEPGSSSDERAALPSPNLYHVALTSTADPSVQIEVRIAAAPLWSNVVMALEFDRRMRWGERYALDASELATVDGHEWLRTAFRFAHSDGALRIGRAVEYATTDREQIYVVTMFGTPEQIEATERVVAPSLRVRSQTGKPMVSQATHASRRSYPGPIGRAFDSTVMVIVADVVAGRPVARGGGSGVVVGADGSVLTNDHVLRRKKAGLADLFVIARYSAIDRAPQIHCAGRPSRSKLLTEVDLALIKCDTDLDGRRWIPGSATTWVPLPDARSRDLKIGERIWVIGYPEGGHGGLRLDHGFVQAFTGPDGTPGREYIKTDASISSGSSGGPVVNDRGELIGIASAYRAHGRVGLVRPLHAAGPLLPYAAAGWTPLDNRTEVDLSLPETPAAAQGVRIFTTVVDNATAAPIANALVVLLRPGLPAATIDLNRLDVQTAAWGKTDDQGQVHLKQPVSPGTYSLVVIAAGYETLVGDGGLRIDDNTPASLNPWGTIELRAR